MTNAARVLQILAEAPGPVCDDCVSARASVFPRQQVFQIATRLARAGQIVRGAGPPCTYCGGRKKVNTDNVLSGVANSAWEQTFVEHPSLNSRLPTPPPSEIDSTRAWHWEGNVQAVFRRFLEDNGWIITACANTGTKESGIDLAAVKEGRELVVEVKGFPGTTYEHGERRGMPKPTQPTTQARHWYSHALLSIMRLREKRPRAEVALCFPDFPTYHKLIDGTRSSLELLAVGVYLISAEKRVSALLPHGGAGRERLDG